MQSTCAVGGDALISATSHVSSLIPACSGATEGWDIAPAGFAYAVCVRCRFPSVVVVWVTGV
eukprot:2479347-Rhodomonas_salina.1